MHMHYGKYNVQTKWFTSATFFACPNPGPRFPTSYSVSHFFCIDSVCVTLLLSYSNLFLISAMLDNWQDQIRDNFQNRLTS